MGKLINKNFDFLNWDDINFNEKNIVIDKINEIHSMISLKDFKQASIEFGILVEKVLTNFLLMKNYNVPPYLKTIDMLIKEIQKNFGNSFDSNVINACHAIRILRNKNAHNNKKNGETMLSDIISSLNGLREIIWYCFDYDNSDKKLEKFDENIYFSISELKKNIDIIEKDLNNRNFNKNDFIVNKNDLQSIMTQDRIIVIPIYQRGYSWSVNQIETLFNDIISRVEDGSIHYFGIIAGKNARTRFDEKHKIKIIDGQQRLTTAFLFISAMRDIMLKNFNIILKDEAIISKILRPGIDSYFYNPGGSIENNNAFKNILNNRIEICDKKSKYYENFIKFKELIQNLLDTKKRDLEYLRHMMAVFLTKFELGTISFDNDNVSNKKEMEIFENLNSKGLELSIEDLIKNFIFNLCSEELLQNEGEKEIPQLWNLNILSELNNDKSLIEDFFISLIQYNKGEETSTNRQIQLKDLKETIHQLFNIEINKELNNIDEYKTLINTIKNYSIIYYDIVYKKGEIIGKWLGVDEIINLCGVQNKISLFTGMVYLIDELLKRNKEFSYIKKLPEKNIKDIKLIFLTIMKLITKNSITIGMGDSTLKRRIIKYIYLLRNKLLKNQNITIEEIRKEFDLLIIENEKNNNEDFRKALMNNSKAFKGITWLLVLTEWTMSDYINSGSIIKYKNPTIEHIMPQNIIDWKNDLLKEKIPEIQWPTEIDKIGNYFVLEKPKNSASKNFIFSVKKDTYKLNTSPLFCCRLDNDIDISNQSSWNFEKIEKRTQKLIDYICNNVIK